MTATSVVTELPLMEAFYTLQGEGRFAGHAAFFLRLGGCDVGCPWCDTKDSWEAEKFPKVAVEKMADLVQQHHAPIAVITGGEPLMHHLDGLTDALKKRKIRTHLETSGAYPLSGSWDWITLSPKKMKKPLPEMVSLANELKVVIYNRSDFEWADQFSNALRPEAARFLQPEWSREEKVLPQIIEYIKAHPEWALSLQTHKHLKIP